MSTDTFRRHVRTSVDAALHALHASLRHEPRHRSVLDRLLPILSARSNALTWSPTRGRELVQVALLRNLVPFADAFLREPEYWSGASGHPLVVADSLARHLFGEYPTPRFLASAWLAPASPTRLQRTNWFIRHARGHRFRSLALPFTMTRQMEHIFLRTPDHYAIDPALRRAEVLALGGTPALAEAVIATPLAEDFTNAERWRVALAWLARCGESVDLTQVGPLVDFLREHLDETDLRGRTFASVMRLVRTWHRALPHRPYRDLAWEPSRWQPLHLTIHPTRDERRTAEWSIVELLDTRALVEEGRAMHHCVATYARTCFDRRSSIWSVRHRWMDDPTWRSTLTVEISLRAGTIIQLRGKANALPRGEPLDRVRAWAKREGLHFHRWVEIDEVPTVRSARG